MAFYRWSSNPIQLAWSVRNNMENHSLASFIQLLSFSTEGREKTFSIPIEKLDFAYSRCSGPGGQNVNKLNTKAELRFHVENADWLSADVKGRLHAQQANRINNDGELLVTSQEHRTQGNNRDSCIKKLKEIIGEAFIEPKEREQYEGLSERNKTVRKVEKRARSEVKQNRGRSKNDD